MEKIHVFLTELDKDSWGYDVQILDPSATVADYLAALNGFQDAKIASCLGCSGCCWERAPLTAPDIFNYGDELFGGQSSHQPVRRFLEKYGLVYAKAGVVDIILRRRPSDACIFLDVAQHRCQQHPLRSLVCQSYICLPTSARAAQLRSQLVNAGENELIRLYYLEFEGEEPWLDEGSGPVDWGAYSGGGFRGKTSFAQIRLREVLEAPLFQQLLR